MAEIAIYVRNLKLNPSGYYRIGQYLESFHNYKIREACHDKIYYNYHFKKNIFHKLLYYFSIYLNVFVNLFLDNIKLPKVVIINREISPRSFLPLSTLLFRRLCKKCKIIWDIDDDLLSYKEISKKEWNLLEKYSAKIIISTENLKKLLNPQYIYKCIFLPTTDGDINFDISCFEEKKKIYENEVRLAWVATASSLPYIQEIIGQLDKAADVLKKSYSKKLILYCVCNKQLICETKSLIIKNILWSRMDAINAIHNSHIGIMPLSNTTFAQNKGGFKLIQFMAGGLPVLGSEIGINSKIIFNDVNGQLIKDDWVTPLVDLSSNIFIWEKYSKESRKIWEREFSFDYNNHKLHEIINELNVRG